MGTLTIDTIQSAQITTLQNDVSELTTKLNAVVTDIATLKSKVDTLITDVTSLKDKIGTVQYGNTSGSLSGAVTDPILKRLHDLDSDYVSLSDFVNDHVVNAANNPSFGHGSGGYSAGRGGGGTALVASFDITGASTSSSGSVTQTASAASTTGVYTPQSQQVITVTDASATRAREVARDAVKRIRGI